MNSKVFIVPDQSGNVIRQSRNPELGYVRLTQDRITINNRGWVNKKTFSTLLKGSIEDLKTMGIDNMDYMPGNIIVQESTTPFNEAEPNRDLKVAGDTGVVLHNHNGEPIYRTTIYDQSGCMSDILIPHANGEEIKKKIGKKKKSNLISNIDIKKIVKDVHDEIDFDSLIEKNEFSSAKKEKEETFEQIETITTDDSDDLIEEELVEELEDDIEFDL
jgi:hypothetical protein